MLYRDLKYHATHDLFPLRQGQEIDLFKTLFLTAIVCIDNKKIYRELYMGIQHLVKDNGYDLLFMLQ